MQFFKMMEKGGKREKKIHTRLLNRYRRTVPDIKKAVVTRLQRWKSGMGGGGCYSVTNLVVLHQISCKVNIQKHSFEFICKC